MYKHVMVPLDGSELAECVLPHVGVIAGGWSLSTSYDFWVFDKSLV